MPRHGRHSWKQMLAGASIATAIAASSTSNAFAQLPDASPAAETTPLQPSLIDFITGAPVSAKMQDLAKPKLLRKAFGGLPKADPKGLAALIKAKEVDVPNRVKAAKYLGSVDCQEFPESQLALKDLLLDEFEPVRFEAAKALQTQFSRGSEPGVALPWNENVRVCMPWQRNSKRKDTCRGCCSTDDIQQVIDVMHDQAYGVDDYGCHKEPSERVRKVLSEAINLCVHCECQYEAPVQAVPLEPQVEPSVSPESGEGSAKPALPKLPSENETAAPAEVPKADDAKPAVPPAPAESESAGLELEDVQGFSSVGGRGIEPATSGLNLESVSFEEESLDLGSSPLLPEQLELTVSEPEQSAQNATETPPAAGDLDDGVSTESAQEAASDADSAISQVEFESAGSQVSQVELATDSTKIEVAPEPQPLEILKGHCPVQLIDGAAYAAGRDEFSTLHQGYFGTYRIKFSSQEALATFKQNPERYFPVLDGACAATWSRTGMKMNGKYIALYNGKFYAFAIQALAVQFKEDPESLLKALDQKLQKAAH